MALLHRTLNASLRHTSAITRLGRPSARAAALHVSSVRSALSESDRHTDDVDQKIDHHKQDQLRKQKEGKGHWSRELASDSEASVKADRGEHGHTSTADMQKDTAAAAEKKHKEEGGS